MSELCGISMQQLNEHFSAQAKWIYNIARGMVYLLPSFIFSLLYLINSFEYDN